MRRLLPLILPVLILAVAPVQPASAQQADTVAVADRAAAEPPGPPYSPRGAFFRSLVLPGWGQVYVDAPVRGAFYFGLGAGSWTMTYLAHRDLSAAREQFEREVASGAADPGTVPERVRAGERRFEDWAAFSVFVMFFAGADAYVSAYLADFDDRIGVRPVPDGGLEIRYHLPVGRLP